MVKKKVNRSVERSRDKKAPNITQTTSVNIKIVPEALKPKKKKKRKGTSKKKKVIEEIKQALNELAQLKEEAKEKGVTIPAELGELPTDADDLKTLEQLQGLLAELKNKNAKINDIVIIFSFIHLYEEEVKDYQPKVILVDENNKIV